MRILIVEDEVKIRRGLASLILRETDHEIVGEAKNGREGLEQILLVNPDLVITDIRMPEMDGLAMIEALNEQQIQVHCVILSGYSEFEYAKKAIRFGVDDYLLKPLAPEDILGLLEKIHARLAQENKQQSDTAMHILGNRLSRAFPEGDSVADFAALKMEEGTVYYLLSGYGKNTLPAERQEWLARLRVTETKRTCPDMHFCLLEETRELVCLLPGRAVKSFCEEMKWYMERTGRKWVWACAEIKDFEYLYETMKMIRKLYLYGFSDGQIVTEKAVSSFAPETFTYPEELEGKIRGALYRGDIALLQQYISEFQSCMGNEAFAPPQIKDAYARLIRGILRWIEDAGKGSFGKIESLHYSAKIDHAFICPEMKHILDELIHDIAAGKEQREDISNYAIKRAINYIRIHFAENISLEEIADRLDFTPEYLSALFNREVGINFSTFLRDFRISHAKRLLKGTDKRIYEIAQEVGYPDAKYFNRVFKEKVGVSPKEFRQM